MFYRRASEITWQAQRKLLQGWIRSPPSVPVLLLLLLVLFTWEFQMSALTLPIDISVTKTEGKGSSKHHPVTSWQTELSSVLSFQGNHTSANAISALGISWRPLPRGSWLTKHPVNLTHLIWPGSFLCVLSGTRKHCRWLASTNYY